ncbi:ABC transporter substrate-binding protein [Fonticella tunisiensis]|uniref:Carbohydrate ABC transporter substrate-binding protein (CUT1 family) n=1 Tax=Fonticella tunisiensis TaxID=1096341 RepID=A0A4R7KQZ2_9CLOT|nr:extracellular solute-binding protein [Fonticella tunisiensis]TDT61146.1 carbohydrate ABC transporter substrate-binding protein (CUT1 family) [Fonticella tunisiensis]
MKKHISFWLVLILFISMGLYGCSSADNKKQMTTIKLATFYSSNEQGEIYKTLAREYEKNNKNVKVEVITDFGDDEKIKEALTKEGDFSLIGVTRQQLIEYAKSGLIRDITSFVDEKGLNDKLYKISTAYGKYNGKIYGIGDLPMTIEWFYNPDIFNKYGIKEPKTLDELISACSILKKNNVIPISIGAMDGWTLSTLFGMITAQTTGVKDLTSYYGSDAASFKKLPGIDEAFKIYGKIVASCIPKESADINYAASIDDFVKGKAAILPAGSWATLAIEEKKPANFNYKVFQTEVDFVNNPVSRYSATAGQILVIPNNAKHSKEAQDFIEFLLSEQGQKAFIEKGYISPLISANNRDKELKNQIMTHLEMTNDDSVMIIDNMDRKMGDSLTRVLQDIQEGRVNPSEGWSRVLKLTFQQ